jgi:hypothetical protein
MLRKKGKKELDNSRLASVKREMAKPRMATSARIAELGPTQKSSERFNGRELPTQRLGVQPQHKRRGRYQAGV